MKEPKDLATIEGIKQKLRRAGLEGLLDDLVYMPVKPVPGTEHEFVLTHVAGVAVARLVNPPQE